ncbi:MAG TPA: twin-arginine translocase subunit TatC [Firmicutes bacterium]|nr:sec-independent protein translocase protein TatC [Bacillota bacterium]MDK2927891.1 sec-independent protein translocase protein TatC [Bacillota bacterium]HHV57791.1 twin-arginine translocase subunit TatC [Bacillota bacterium]
MSELRMTLVEHLVELRKRLIIVAVALVATGAVAYTFAPATRAFFTRPAGSIKLVYLSPTEALTTDIKISFLVGLLVASPLILYQLWAFVAPGLHSWERAQLWPLALASTVLFFAGAAFSYYAVLPLAIRFVLGFATPDLQALFSYSRYISFVTSIILSFGLIFQLPLGVLFLARLGLVTAPGLRRSRRYAILVIFIVAAILTPPDVLSQILMAAPMVALYEISIWLAHLVRAQEKATKDNK